MCICEYGHACVCIQMWVLFLSRTIYLVCLSFETGFSLPWNLLDRLGWSTSEPHGSVYQLPQCWDFKCVPSHPPILNVGSRTQTQVMMFVRPGFYWLSTPNYLFWEVMASKIDSITKLKSTFSEDPHSWLLYRKSDENVYFKKKKEGLSTSL